MTAQEKKNFISLAKAAEGTPYSQEYLSLLVRKGKIDARKFGRNWFVTKTSVNEYLDRQQKVALKKIKFGNKKENIGNDREYIYRGGANDLAHTDTSNAVSDTPLSPHKQGEKLENITGRHFLPSLALYARHMGADAILVGGILAGSFIMGTSE